MVKRDEEDEEQLEEDQEMMSFWPSDLCASLQAD